MFPASSDTVTFSHVTVLKRDALTLTCLINGRTVVLGSGMPELSSTILNGCSKDGTLILTRWRARELGLLEGQTAI